MTSYDDYKLASPNEDRSEDLFPEKPKLCDICGEPFAEASYPVVNENHAVQEGLIQCVKCYSSVCL